MFDRKKGGLIMNKKIKLAVIIASNFLFVAVGSYMGAPLFVPAIVGLVHGIAFGIVARDLV